MRLLGRLFLLAASAGFFLTGPIHAESREIAALGVTFPDELAGIRETTFTDFEKQTPGLGVSLTYQTETLKADIYVYDFRLDSIPTGAEAALTVQQFRIALSDISTLHQRGIYLNLTPIVSQELVTINGVPFLHAKVTFDLDGIPRVSHLYLTAIDNQFLKVRCTYHASSAAEDQKKLQSLMEALASLVRPKGQ